MSYEAYPNGGVSIALSFKYKSLFLLSLMSDELLISHKFKTNICIWELKAVAFSHCGFKGLQRTGNTLLADHQEVEQHEHRN